MNTNKKVKNEPKKSRLKPFAGAMGVRDQFFENEAIRGKKWERRLNSRREMGEK